MTMRPSYARFYASKWRSGTLMLSLEEEGLYIRISAFQMECGQPLPCDWKEAARLLCVQPLKYRKIVDSLIAKGKILDTPEGLICERAMAEFNRALKGVDPASQASKDNPHTYPHTNPGTYLGTMGVEAEKDELNQGQFRNRREEKKEELAATPEQEPARASPSGAALPVNFDELEAKLIGACNGSLDNPANCQGLLNLAVPQMWLQQGYDLETEIIPTLRAAGKKYHGKRIRDWNYFTPMIAETRVKRAKVDKPAAPVDRSNMEYIPPMYGKPGRWIPKREAVQ